MECFPNQGDTISKNLLKDHTDCYRCNHGRKEENATKEIRRSKFSIQSTSNKNPDTYLTHNHPNGKNNRKSDRFNKFWITKNGCIILKTDVVIVICQSRPIGERESTRLNSSHQK